MSEYRKFEVSVIYSPDRDELSFHLAGDEANSLNTWRLPDLACLGGDELERKLGAAILGALTVQAGRNIGPRDYLADSIDRMVERIDLLRERLAKGDGSVVISIVLNLLTIAKYKDDKRYVEEAELLLIDQAARGNQRASEYLSSRWDYDKNIFAKHLLKKP